jgi:hypothetical protein
MFESTPDLPRGSVITADRPPEPAAEPPTDWWSPWDELDPDGGPIDATGPTEWSRSAPDGLLADQLEERAGRAGLDDAERLELVGAWESVMRWAQARQLQQISALLDAAERRENAAGDRLSPGPQTATAAESVAGEISLVLRIPARSAAGKVAMARDLCGRLGPTVRAMARGSVGLPSARAIADGTVGLDRAQTAEVERLVLPPAAGQTAAQLGLAVRRAAMSIDPAAAVRRHQARRRRRGVRVDPVPDGMATLIAHLSALEATGMFAVLDERARRLTSTEDGRSLNERRADALVESVLSTTGTCHGCSADTSTSVEPATAPRPSDPPGRLGADVRVTVPFGTLMGLDDRPGELAGYGPLPADVVREIAAHGTWRRILTDPVTGAVLEVGHARYRPSRALLERVHHRDGTCRFPTCEYPAHRCDVDHSDPFASGGPTIAANLSAKCRLHHRLKQRSDWRVEQDDAGVVTWTTPSGRVHVSEPYLARSGRHPSTDNRSGTIIPPTSRDRPPP